MNITSNNPLNFNDGLTDRPTSIVTGTITEVGFNPTAKTLTLSYHFKDADDKIINAGVREIDEAQINTVLNAVQGDIPADLDPIDQLKYRYYLALRFQMKQTFEPLNVGLKVTDITVNP